MENRDGPNIFRLGPRIPSPVGIMDSVLRIAVPDRLVEPRSASTTTSSSSSSTSCAPNDDSGRCEKPVSSSTFTLPIVLGVVVPIFGALIAFLILHRRYLRKQREEEANDRHASMDFGLGDVPRSGSSRFVMGSGEKDLRKTRQQLSMDMNHNSPYLLPPELQNSRESLHSLSRTILQHEDPYRPVASYSQNDGSSIRSPSRMERDGSSVYTGSSAAPSRLHELGTSELLPNASAMPRSLAPIATLPPRQQSLPQNNTPSNRPESLSNSPLPQLPHHLAEPPQVYLQEMDAGTGRPVNGLPVSPRPSNGLVPPSAIGLDGRESYSSNGGLALRESDNYLGAFVDARAPSPAPPPPPSKDPRRELPTGESPPSLKSLPASPRPPKRPSLPSIEAYDHPAEHDPTEYGDGFHVTPPSPTLENRAERVRASRYSMDVPPEEFAQAGLGAPGFDPRRISMGFRPLPPEEVIETDDPEVRANRIRSFYKEYFDDSKPAPQGQYYEDYDESYMGDVAYFDPDTNNFVMPYAEPVTRRAMTPPPRGPRFQGPPRALHGSMGAMSMGRMRGPQMYPPGPYPQGPKAYSSASGRMGNRGPRRPIPPPADLTSLPTPSKLRDDSFALMNATDFAPPRTYRDRVAGRSESPLGERRPYSPAVPSFAPLVSAFDELAAMPSPHMLRKSGTFTGLDFAPPKRFKDPESMSDSGSIRSNRSGVSAVQLGAIRQGAYRVSRIPQDVVFAKDDLASLKPQWGMRVGS